MRYIYDIGFRMLQVRENEISLRKWSGGTAQLLTLEGTLMSTAKHALLFRNYTQHEKLKDSVSFRTTTLSHNRAASFTWRGCWWTGVGGPTRVWAPGTDERACRRSLCWTDRRPTLLPEAQSSAASCTWCCRLPRSRSRSSWWSFAPFHLGRNTHRLWRVCKFLNQTFPAWDTCIPRGVFAYLKGYNYCTATTK